MTAYLVEHMLFILVFQAVSALLGLWIKLINERFIKTGDVVLAVIFGIFYLVTQAYSWDTVLITIPPKK